MEETDRSGGGRAAVRYSSCQAGTGSEECVGKDGKKKQNKKTSTFIFGIKGGAVASSESCLVLLSASALTVRSLNRWTPASWWSWEGEEEGFCWVAEAECAASRQKYS